MGTLRGSRAKLRHDNMNLFHLRRVRGCSAWLDLAAVIMQENPAWAVGAFGSCRVNTPLSLIGHHGLISYRFDSAVGYLHNPLELQQAIKILRGEKRAPLELYKLINITSAAELKHEDRFYRLYTNIDVIVCEVSSIRIIEYNGWFLQLNRFRELVGQYGISERETSELFRSPESKMDLASRLTDGPGVDFARDIVMGSQFYEMDSASLKEEILRLRSLMADHPVIFVGIATQDFEGNPIRQRTDLRDALSSVAEISQDTAFIDPTAYVMRDGMGVAMQDLGHYNKAYELIAAGEIFRQLDAFCRSNVRVNALANRRKIRAANRSAAAAAMKIA